jgi:hypothetical protein
MMTIRDIIRSAATAALFAVAVVACARGRNSNGDPVDPSLPHIDRVRPDSVLVPRDNIVEVTIIGRRFAPGTPGKNTIQFAGTSITQVPANANGTEIRFAVPDAIPSGNQAPPLHLETGTYTIRITTAAGTSNPMPIRIFR